MAARYFQVFQDMTRVHLAEAVRQYLARQMALLPLDKIYPLSPWFQCISEKYHGQV